MTIKTTVSFTDQQHAMALELVKTGDFASVSAVVAHGMRLVHAEREEQAVRLDALREELRARAAIPSDDLIAWDGADMAARIERRLRSKLGEE